MGKGRKVLSNDHAHALIKQAVAIVFGDARAEAEAAAEIATIEAVHVQTAPKPRRFRRSPT
ncbi:hypothetical protein [Methylorubrum extorquens]|jgi:hypothetical protein|uniref:hypothetical protein n=1 Tax=Methylorubrum extorquens TaxID=408 RepID=UPI002237C107|nr:hypothetical protein [Methylorubrum extorquens]UYW25081.1 hypothetical protein OKC48_17630 [Methylorubrum extorquens]UYW35061.1 hypothetical protein OKB92_13520 [Methylorubrum extorquens]